MRSRQARLVRPKRLRLNRELTLACRLCLKLGIDDPLTWLETVDDEVFATWEAYYRLEPFGDERFLLARIVSLLSMLMATKLSADDASKVVAEVKDLMPSDWVWQPERVETNSIEAAESVLARMFG